MKPARYPRVVVLVGWLILCLGIGALGSLTTRQSIAEWYFFLNKPPLNPPKWIFAPVWTSLYILMAIAAFRVSLRTDHPACHKATLFFLAQLLMNGIWSPVFFGLRRPFVALAIILILWVLIMKTHQLFRRIDPFAAWLLVPYWAWVSFATYLNSGIAWLNR